MSTSPSKLDPAPPQRRDEVISRTPLRVRERIAWCRYWWHVYPARRGAILACIAFPLVEHHETTFPAIAGFFAKLASAYVG